MLIETEMVLDGKAAIVRLARPGGLNPLNGALLDELDGVLDELATKDGLHVLIVTGSDKAFSVGADLKESLDDPNARVARMHRLVQRLADFPALSIAAIEGWALGGGLELAMACTFRVAAGDARMGLPEVGLGAIPSYGGTQLTPRLVGASHALELLCMGETIDAERAERIGLVNWIAEAPDSALAKAQERAGVLAKLAKPALLAAREAVREGQGSPLADALAVEARTSKQLQAAAGVSVAAAFASRSTSR